MRLASVPVNKEVVSLGTGDFNGDGKPDLVYYGTPAEVEILFNEGGGRFGGSKKISSGDAVETPGALAVGDLDQDGRDDIACWPRTTLSSSTRLHRAYFPSRSACLTPQASLRHAEASGPGWQRSL